MRGVIRRSAQAIGYLLGGGVTAVGTAGAMLLITLVLLTTPVSALLTLPVVAVVDRWIADIERRRATAMLGEPIAAEYRVLPPRTPPAGLRGLPRRWGRAITRSFTDSATYRDALWVVVHTAIGPALAGLTIALWIWILSVVTLPLWWRLRPVASDDLVLRGAALVPIAVIMLLWMLPALAVGQARIAAGLLAPPVGRRLAARVTELARSRAEALEAHSAELRRIERDLHDGAQARIVSVALLLGVVERRLDTDPEAVASLVRQAREGAETALIDLRGLVRGMYPPVLADRGLAGAIGALVTRGPVPVAVDIGSGRLPAAVEAAAYFTIAEALTNVGRHSGAAGAAVRLRRQGQVVVIEVWDDGIGGADERRGSGLQGIRRRVQAFDGRLEVDSPRGGPTNLRVELPCGL
jgi:signal transduction histidine kinase